METELISRENIPYQSHSRCRFAWRGYKNLAGKYDPDWRRDILNPARSCQQFNPDVLFFTGGYVAVPMALAATAAQVALVCT